MTYAERARYKQRMARGVRVGAGLHEGSRPSGLPFKDRRLPDLEAPDYFESEQPIAEMMTVGQLRRYVQELLGQRPQRRRPRPSSSSASSRSPS